MITFRGARQTLSTSYDLLRDEKPTHDGHSLWPFSHGNHAFSHGDDCEAEMFFSYLKLVLLLLFVTGKAIVTHAHNTLRAAKV